MLSIQQKIAFWWHVRLTLDSILAGMLLCAIIGLIVIAVSIFE